MPNRENDIELVLWFVKLLGRFYLININLIFVFLEKNVSNPEILYF